MSSKAIDLVWEFSHSRANGKVLMLAVAERADEHLLAWLSLPHLVRACRIKESSLWRLLDDLEERCELYVIRQSRQGDICAILLTRKWDELFVSLTRGAARLSKNQALREIATIHSRVEALFADPTQRNLRREQLTALEQLRVLPPEYRLEDET